MGDRFSRFYRMLADPLLPRSRVLIGLLVIPLALSFALPLWHMDFRAPQYPQGLSLDIFSYTIEGDVQEINTLNHYIGMKSIDKANLSDLDWLPFAISAFSVLCLRVAVVGDFRALIDLWVGFAYFSTFSLIRFVYRLYIFGHNLDPKAPISVDAFTPAILGTKQIANFTTISMPAGGTVALAVFAVGLTAALAWNAVGLGDGSAGEPRRSP